MSVEPNKTTKRPPQIDRLVHEPARYNILALLYVMERAEFLFILHQLEITPGNLSAHLSKLESGGYVMITKKFVGKKPRTFLELTKEGRRAFEDYRKDMMELLKNPPESMKDV